MICIARAHLRWLVTTGVLITAAPAVADLADVYLRNGLKLRGDVSWTNTELILHNVAGEVRIPRVQLARVETVEAAETPVNTPAKPQPDTPPQDEPPADTPPADQPADDEPLPGIPPPTPRDIQLLRLQELQLTGQPEAVRVRFESKRGEPEVDELVLEELKGRADFDPTWEEILLRGRPYEKLQLILRETGLKHTDRITVLNDPEAFQLFRRQVLPLVSRSCARAGCHGGPAAHLFRFPSGPKNSERYAYGAFVLLDEMQTPDGRLINREEPEQSLLVQFMLPRAEAEYPHPEVAEGPPFRPVLRNVYDPQYHAVINWIRFLLDPRVDYGLKTPNPYAGVIGQGVERLPAEQAEENAEAP